MTEHETITAAELRWNETYLAKDVRSFAALLDDSFVYLSERGEFAKAAYVANLSSGEIEMRDLATLDSRTRVFGDIAIVTGRVRMSASFRGQDISGEDAYTRIWRRTDSGWSALSQHASQVAAG
jgi:ketosteroid isomerase-like protein